MNNGETKAILEPHGAGKAFYNRIAGSDKMAGSPTIGCLCGWLPQEIFETWEQAGKALDIHISLALRRQVDGYNDHQNELRENRGDLLRAKAAARR